MALKYFKKNFYSALFLVGVFLVFLISSLSVFGQSQEDVNPYFDPNDEAYVKLNYDCSTLPYPIEPKKAVGVYRKVSFDAIPGVTPMSVGSGQIYVASFYIYEGESIGDLERESSKFSEPGRKLPDPQYISQDRADDQSDTILGDYANTAVCGSLTLQGHIVQAHFIPPALQQLENLVIDVIYVFISFLGVFLGFNIIRIGFEYMTSLGNPDKKAELHSRILYWTVALIAIFAVVPVLSSLFSFLGVETTKCFYYNPDGGDQPVYDITLPGFTFFFSDVCTGDFSIEDTPKED